MTVLKTENLTKRYGRNAAVDGVSLSVEQGDIFGLIGQNGAGKTTLMRLVASLSFPDSGSIELFGETTAHGLRSARRRMGCVVETPALYPNMTAAQNLEYYRLQRGIPETDASRRALELANLTDTGKKKFKNFSLGMKQRLGMALAILSRPDFLILDEPINGLDPTGIIETRDLIKRFSEQGVTVLISSHILTELSHVATKLAVIHHGRLIKTVTQNQLREECKRSLVITVDDPARTAAILESQFNIRNYKQTGNNEFRIYEALDKSAAINGKLAIGGVNVASIYEAGDSLEEYFQKTIGGASV